MCFLIFIPGKLDRGLDYTWCSLDSVDGDWKQALPAFRWVDLCLGGRARGVGVGVSGHQPCSRLSSFSLWLMQDEELEAHRTGAGVGVIFVE